MLGIVIPLKSKLVSNNWDVVCNSLEKTMSSINNQISDQYKVIVVGHECPAFLESSGVFYNLKEYSPPNPKFEVVDQDRYTLDKNLKIVKGMMILSKLHEHITHWFPLDADDLLHAKFVDTLMGKELKNGAIIDNGYIYYSDLGRVIPSNEFSLYCGSSSIVASKFISLPNVLNEKTVKSTPFGKYAHMNMNQYFEKELKCDYFRPTENLIMYVLYHGENISDGYRKSIIDKLKYIIKTFIVGRKLTKIDFKNFSI